MYRALRLRIMQRGFGASPQPSLLLYVDEKFRSDKGVVMAAVPMLEGFLPNYRSGLLYQTYLDR